MILCEQCGNEFQRGTLIKREEVQYIVCPYCGHENKRVYRKRKKRGAK